MANLYKSFKTDNNLERDGIWLEYGYADEAETRPIRIRIARAGGTNIRFAKILEAKTKPHRRAFQTETMDEKTATKLFAEVYAEGVLLGWENVDDENGEPMEFTKANVLKLFDDLPDLYNDIRAQANKAGLFRQEMLEADLGN